MDALWAAEAAAESGGAGFWHLALVMMAIGFLGFFARWRNKRRKPVPAAREIREKDADPDRYRDAADRAIVDLLETSRSLNAQVDTKIRVLNRLVKDAENNCARLEALLAKAGALAGEGPPAPAAVPPPAPAASEDTVLCPAPARSFPSELHERIFRLREQGRTVADIAKATNLSTTEVRFALESMEVTHD